MTLGVKRLNSSPWLSRIPVFLKSYSTTTCSHKVKYLSSSADNTGFDCTRQFISKQSHQVLNYQHLEIICRTSLSSHSGKILQISRSSIQSDDWITKIVVHWKKFCVPSGPYSITQPGGGIIYFRSPVRWVLSCSVTSFPEVFLRIIFELDFFFTDFLLFAACFRTLSCRLSLTSVIHLPFR